MSTSDSKPGLSSATHEDPGSNSGERSTRIRRITLGAVGLLVLAAALVGGMRLKAGTGDAQETAVTATTSATRQARPAVNVVVEAVREMQFERALSVQGNVEAKQVALVSPRLAGVLDAVFVDEGDEVIAGETPLFQTDAVNLANTVEMRRREVDVAEHALREKQASLEKEQADYEQAEYDWKRYLGLFEKGVTANDEVEEARTHYRACAALVKHAEALVDLADAQLKQARSALAIAQKDLDDSLVIAPINGRVAERFQEPGEMGDVVDPVLRIEDPALVEVSVFLPARVYGEVVPGVTVMRVAVSGVDLGEHRVCYKSATIDTRLRTFEARCLLHDPPEVVAPGAMAQVKVVLERREGWGVPRGAIQDRSGGTVVFVAEGERARMVPLKLGLETEGMAEVLPGELRQDAQVIVVGGYFLDPDDAIKVTQEAH